MKRNLPLDSQPFLSLSLPFPDPAMTYNLVYIYIVGEEGLAKLNQTACILCTPNT